MVNTSIEKLWFGTLIPKTNRYNFLKILWKTDKVNFIYSNLMCVYTHPKFQNIKFCLSFFHKIFKKMISICFRYQSTKSELFDWCLNHLLISLQSFVIWDSGKIFLWNLPKSTTWSSALLNFVFQISEKKQWNNVFVCVRVLLQVMKTYNMWKRLVNEL